MQKTTQAYRDQMRKGIRNVSCAEVRYDIISAEAEAGAALSDNGHESFSSLDIKGSEESLPGYHSFEPGRWRLDRPLLLLPEDGELLNTGFLSAEMSGADGVFQTPPTVTVTFSEPQSFYGFTFTFDTAAGEYPAEIQINGESFFPDAAQYAAPVELDAVTSVTISWLRSSQPYRRARLTGLVFGQIVRFQNDQLIKLSYRSLLDFLSTALPQKTLSFTIDNSRDYYNPLNPSGILKYVEERQPITFRFGYTLDDGSVEWVEPEHLILKGTPSTRGLEATFTASDSLSMMDGMFSKGLYRPDGITLYELAEEVLTDAGVEGWELDDRLREITTKGPLPAATHSECLQIIANAGQCILYLGRDGGVRMENALDPVITPYDNGHVFFSDPAEAFNSQTPPEVKYLDFLPGAWAVGSEKLVLLPESGEYRHVGFVSEAVCGADGVFETPPVYGLRYSFPAPIYAIPLIFDGITGECAADFDVVYFKEGAEVDRLEVRDNTEAAYTIEHNVPKTDDIQIKILRWSVGARRAAINQIGKGRVNDFTLRLDDVTEQPSVQKQALCRSVTVNCYSYAVGGEIELYREQAGADGQELTLLINHSPATGISASMTGGTVVSAEHYTYQSVITVFGAGELVLTGKELVTTTTSIIRTINPRGEDKDPLENPLITSMAMAADTAEWVADYFAKRNILTAPYRGSPELDAYDMIYMESRFQPVFPVRTMESWLDFNGGLSGKVKAVMV